MKKLTKEQLDRAILYALQERRRETARKIAQEWVKNAIKSAMAGGVKK